jgi:hypothetical protein
MMGPPGRTIEIQITLRHAALTSLRASHKLAALVKVTIPGATVQNLRRVLVTMPPTAKKQ